VPDTCSPTQRPTRLSESASLASRSSESARHGRTSSGPFDPLPAGNVICVPDELGPVAAPSSPMRSPHPMRVALRAGTLEGRGALVWVGRHHRHDAQVLDELP
jgi:hypothetical protein